MQYELYVRFDLYNCYWVPRNSHMYIQYVYFVIDFFLTRNNSKKMYELSSLNQIKLTNMSESLSFTFSI